jgi:hypothetical protein
MHMDVASIVQLPIIILLAVRSTLQEVISRRRLSASFAFATPAFAAPIAAVPVCFGRLPQPRNTNTQAHQSNIESHAAQPAVPVAFV